jgi:hypothetical protein
MQKIHTYLSLPLAILGLSLLSGCGGKKESEITIYLKKNSGDIVRVPECEVSVLTKDTIEKIHKMRKSIKDHYMIRMVGEDTEKKLKERNYSGPWHPEEIDVLETVYEQMSKCLGCSIEEIANESSATRLVYGLSVAGDTRAELKREWEDVSAATAALQRTLQFMINNRPSLVAKEAGQKAVSLIAAERKSTFKTNLDGKAKIQLSQDDFVFMFCLVDNTLVAWILPANTIQSPGAEISQSEAFVIESFPQSVAELHDDQATLEFFFNDTPLGEDNVLPALLLSDEFYNASKNAIKESENK